MIGACSFLKCAGAARPRRAAAAYKARESDQAGGAERACASSHRGAASPSAEAGTRCKHVSATLQARPWSGGLQGDGLQGEQAGAVLRKLRSKVRDGAAGQGPGSERASSAVSACCGDRMSMCSSSRSHASSASVSPARASQISSDRHDARSARTPCCAGGARPGTPGRQPLPGGLSTAFIPIGLARWASYVGPGLG